MGDEIGVGVRFEVPGPGGASGDDVPDAAREAAAEEPELAGRLVEVVLA